MLDRRLSPILSNPALSPAAKLVAVALSSFADREGLCWPSTRALAEMTALSERQVFRALAALEAAGAVERIARHNGDGRRRSNLYRFATLTDCQKIDVPGKTQGAQKELTNCQGGEGDNLSGRPCQIVREDPDRMSEGTLTNCQRELKDFELVQKEPVSGVKAAPRKPRDRGPGTASLMALFGARCPGLPKPGKVTRKREAAVRRAIRGSPERETLDWWRALFDRIAASRFLNGGGSRGWKADWDWILEEEHLERIVEGRYDDGARGRPKGREEDLGDYVARMMEEAGLDDVTAHGTS